jgi:hypothetical protein
MKFPMRILIWNSKQGLESEIAPETQNDPESEFTDGCDPSKSALDKMKYPMTILIWMQMINPNKYQNQRLAQKTKTDKYTSSLGSESLSLNSE